MQIILPAGVAPAAQPTVAFVQGGPPGPPGSPGVPGTSGDYGYISYAETAGAAPVLFPAGGRTRLTFQPDPTLTLDNLRGIFAGHTYWDGQSILPRATGDDAEIRLVVRVTSLVIGGSIFAEIDIGGYKGTIESDTRVLTFAAGTPEVTRFLFVDYMGATFLANGGAIYLTPSVPIYLTNESLVFYPRGAAS